MRRLQVFYLMVFIAFIGCKHDQYANIVIETNDSCVDTIIIRDINIDQIIAKLPLNIGESEFRIRLDDLVFASIEIKGRNTNVLSILEPSKSKAISIGSDSVIITNSVADSIMRYFLHSQNEVFARYNELIWHDENPGKLRIVFDSLISIRASQLDDCKSNLSKNELGYLKYRNIGLAYNFLYYYGRVVKQYPHHDPFFDFISMIDYNSKFAKSMAYVVLYRLETELIRNFDTIPDMVFFLEYIEDQIESPGTQDFLKAQYIRYVFEKSSFLKKHQHFWSLTALELVLEREKSNSYLFLTNKAASSFISSRKGVPAYNFTAISSKGSKFHLSDFMGKFVVISVWATWCGPCLDERPHLLKLTDKYIGNPEIVFLNVSVDQSIQRWENYIQTTERNENLKELIILDSIKTEFTEKFLIRSIPKYIMIDREGLIINADLPKPSASLKTQIDQELRTALTH
jgi:thiol-disulfide isomerase/thioredoxin